eukprot:6212047-Pleurochrysis_carterae.AAC.3
MNCFSNAATVPATVPPTMPETMPATVPETKAARMLAFENREKKLDDDSRAEPREPRDVSRMENAAEKRDNLDEADALDMRSECAESQENFR